MQCSLGELRFSWLIFNYLMLFILLFLFPAHYMCIDGCGINIKLSWENEKNITVCHAIYRVYQLLLGLEVA